MKQYFSIFFGAERFVSVGNVIYAVCFGWWLALLFALFGCVMMLTWIGRDHGILCFNLARYLLWPFGKYIERGVWFSRAFQMEWNGCSCCRDPPCVSPAPYPHCLPHRPSSPFLLPPLPSLPPSPSHVTSGAIALGRVYAVRTPEPHEDAQLVPASQGSDSPLVGPRRSGTPPPPHSFSPTLPSLAMNHRSHARAPRFSRLERHVPLLS